MKQTRQQLNSLLKDIESGTKSIKVFAAQVSNYELDITRGEDLLPKLKKEIERIEAGLPVWKEKVRTYRLSLKTHQQRRFKQVIKHNLLQKKLMLLEKLKHLEKSK